MGSVPSELSLGFVRPSSTTKTLTFFPETIADFLNDDLEEEKRKIDAFRRELPLCMLLLNDDCEDNVNITQSTTSIGRIHSIEEENRRSWR
uniref:HHO5-like N-terminal domain-containing protein n=1 Tax=Salix viminalis TaxID=40686 RepID=A0A6N2LAH1_SALVM